MELYTRVLAQLPLFILVAMRSSGLFLTAPIFGQQRIPNQVRIMLSLLIAAAVFPLVPVRPVATDAIMYLVACLLELIVGLIYGWCASLIFEGMVLAGQFIGLQMGFAQANILNPDSQTQRPLLSEVYYVMSILIFFSLNGHHFLILAFQKSFNTVPVGTLVFNQVILERIFALFAQVFLIALIIAAPICGLLTLIDLVLGLVARTAPQMNILIISFSIKIYVGLLSLLFSLYFTFQFIHDLLLQLLQQLAQVI
jgi:flagellar biosynthesis protein FliR